LSEPEDTPKPLTPRQLDFVIAYLNCGNASEAARRIGVPEGRAGVRGFQILHRPNVAAFVRKQLDEKWERARMQVPEILGRLAWIARGDPRRFFKPDGTYKPIAELSEEDAACIRGWEDELRFDADGAPPTMTRRIKFADPLPALRTLAQVAQLLAPEHHTTNVFIGLDARLDAATRRVEQARNRGIDIVDVPSIERTDVAKPGG
jgi:phage terminase small subunit